MKLNLANIKNTQVGYSVSQFPDGQQDIVIDLNGGKLSGDRWSLNVEIISRFNSFKDLELIICATKALRRLGMENIKLYIPYLLGARSDRHFQEGGNSYLVDVIAPIINAQNYKEVRVIDVHSDVAQACINNLKLSSNYDLVRWVFMNFPFNTKPINDVTIISPDGGSLKKIYKLCEKLEYKGDVVCCSKSRDENGKLSKFSIPFFNTSKDMVIIDDICDGGRTFIEIAKLIKSMRKEQTGNQGNIYLIVTHGIFSNGFENLHPYFKEIYCTNSIIDKSNINFLKQLDVYG